MIGNLVKKVFGSRNERLLKGYAQQVQKINALEATVEKLSSLALKEKTSELKARVKAGESLDAVLAEAFALVREASKRCLGMRHFDVQLMGGMALHHGNIAEMSTGEGKTLTATLPVYLNALTGYPVHLVTVNDYLARRDAAWMAPLYEALGLRVGVVVPGMEKADKQAAYKQDVIYATNNELGFDYLRDKMVHSQDEITQSVLYYAIVDEVDSILVDEARTPLIISGAAEDSSELYKKMNEIVPKLTKQLEKDGLGDYTVDEKARQAFLSEAGHQRIEGLLQEAQLLGEDQSLYDPANIMLVHHLNAALRAHALFKRDVDYLVSGQQVVIVDEHTGRTMPGRRWSDGLHQAIEAKEGVPIESENQTLASITFQNFFRMYTKLAGMTGTADTEAYEFHQIYGLEVVVIPPNRKSQRNDLPDMVYLTAAEKFDAIIQEIKNCVAAQKPVLVGTISIETSEFLSKILTKNNIKHQVLNAKFHEQEAQIIAEAGRPGAVTIATNMAGRGTDIVLGGSLDSELKSLVDPSPEQIETVKAAWKERHDSVVASGGLHILGTERHESRRIDNQLRGRSGRQGDPGSTQFFLSLEDSLMRIFASQRVSVWMRKLGVATGEAITHPWITSAIENAQRKVEGHNFDIRKQLLEYDNVANDQRRAIYEQRDELLAAKEIAEGINIIREGVIEKIVQTYIPPNSLEEIWDIQGLEQVFLTEFGVQLSMTEWLKEQNQLDSKLICAHIESFMAAQYAAKEQQVGSEILRNFEKAVMLHSLDQHWKEHLAAMDYLRQSIHLRGYAQKDPKQEFKREAFVLFTSMLEEIKYHTIKVLFMADLSAEAKARAIETIKAKNIEYQHDAAQEFAEEVLQDMPAKIGRNEVCPCGSGKKYKACHGTLV